MPRFNPTRLQKLGTEFGGIQQQNTLAPVDSIGKLEPHERARLMKITGQNTDPEAPAHGRCFEGETYRP